MCSSDIMTQRFMHAPLATGIGLSHPPHIMTQRFMYAPLATEVGLSHPPHSKITFVWYLQTAKCIRCSLLGGVKASLSIVTASSSLINPIG